MAGRDKARDLMKQHGWAVDAGVYHDYFSKHFPELAGRHPGTPAIARGRAEYRRNGGITQAGAFCIWTSGPDKLGQLERLLTAEHARCTRCGEHVFRWAGDTFWLTVPGYGLVRNIDQDGPLAGCSIGPGLERGKIPERPDGSLWHLIAEG